MRTSTKSSKYRKCSWLFDWLIQPPVSLPEKKACYQVTLTLNGLNSVNFPNIKIKQKLKYRPCISLCFNFTFGWRILSSTQSPITLSYMFVRLFVLVWNQSASYHSKQQGRSLVCFDVEAQFNISSPNIFYGHFRLGSFHIFNILKLRPGPLCLRLATPLNTK